MVPNYINLYLCVYCVVHMCACVCVVHVCDMLVVYDLICVQVCNPIHRDQRRTSDSCSTTLYLVSLKQKFQLTLKLG